MKTLPRVSVGSAHDDSYGVFALDCEMVCSRMLFFTMVFCNDVSTTLACTVGCQRVVREEWHLLNFVLFVVTHG